MGGRVRCLSERNHYTITESLPGSLARSFDPNPRFGMLLPRRRVVRFTKERVA